MLKYLTCVRFTASKFVLRRSLKHLLTERIYYLVETLTIVFKVFRQLGKGHIIINGYIVMINCFS